MVLSDQQVTTQTALPVRKVLKQKKIIDGQTESFENYENDRRSNKNGFSDKTGKLEVFGSGKAVNIMQCQFKQPTISVPVCLLIRDDKVKQHHGIGNSSGSHA
jgi:hypothetical protein